MEERSIGKSGLRVSVVGLGCNNFGRRIDFGASEKVVHAALDAGITFFDTADVYYSELGSSEEFLGRALGARRADVVVTTKVGMAMDKEGRLRGASRRYLTRAVEASLKRLNTDWIDLCQLHQPDPSVPIEETLRTFDDLVRQGKVRYLGCSNMPAWQVVEARWTSRQEGLEHFIALEDEYSLLARGSERDLIPVAERYGMGLLPFYPLASGMLTGKYRRGSPLPADSRLGAHGARYGTRFVNDANFDVVERLEAFCAARGRTLLELAFGWLLSHDAVPSVIAGATRVEQIGQNVAAAGWALTPEERAEVDQISRSP
ncbi:aldo/keto reductase [Bosea sp. (in: a-proteobacteria)]|uniref:aldo/keto reductase n=1 Tax=Bosea sp. (in: a-proteobacteria) TaxID=1871050 RepID=UPI0026192C19|nr:aldo/keto reductase [Bosea sp. (in: a-proteobacteria)]MCO5091842.1 aldo/keto reductase [Bosea sp. (in: a-proteobacteria)]